MFPNPSMLVKTFMIGTCRTMITSREGYKTIITLSAGVGDVHVYAWSDPAGWLDDSAYRPMCMCVDVTIEC